MKTMTCSNFTGTLDKSRRRTYPERFIADGFNVYRESNLTKAIDKFFSDNEIYALGFKCKTWSRLGNKVTRIEAEAIRSLLKLPDTVEIKWSAKAGCSCGCSPGFKVRKAKNSKLENCDVFITLKFDDLSEIRKDITKAKEDLKKEIKSHE
jgi:hypothetical protein